MPDKDDKLPARITGNGNDRAPVALPFRLRETFALPIGWPPDVAPNQVIASSHINQIRTSVAQWPADVDGMNHKLSNVQLVNATGVMVDPTTTAGDLITRDAGTVPVRFPIGTQGQVLMVDTAVASKLRWATPAPVVASVFGRIGVVVAANGDYTAAQVTNAIDATKTYPDPNWLSSLAWSKITNPPTTFAPAPHNHSAGDITSGVLNTARLGTGIADTNVYLRGDGTWAVPPAGSGGGGAGVASFKGRTGAVVPQLGDYSAAMVSQAVVDQTIALGDLLVRGTAAIARLPAGANGQFLVADNAQALGVRWGVAPGGPGLPAALSNGDIAQWMSGSWQILAVGTVGQTLMCGDAGSGLRWGAGGGGNQTPWLTDVDGGNHALSNVSSIVSNGVIKSNAGGFIFPDGSVQTSAAGQSPWNVDIDAASHNLYNLGRKPGAAVGNVGSAINMRVTDALSEITLDFGTRRTALGSGGAFLEHRIQRAVDGATQGYIAFRSGGQAVTLGNGVQDMMTVADTGNVGIGVASPQYKLDMTGVFSLKGVMRIWGGGGIGHPTIDTYIEGVMRWSEGVNFQSVDWGLYRCNASGVSIDTPITASNATGNVGIGIGSAICRLHVASGVDSAPVLGQAKGNVCIAGTGSSIWGLQIGSVNTGTCWIQAQRSDAQAITYPLLLNPLGGNIGIGTTNPLEALHVAGNAIALHSQVGNPYYYRFLCSPSMDSLAIGYWGSVGSAWYGGTPNITMPFGGTVTIHKTLTVGASAALTPNWDAAQVVLSAAAGASAWSGAPRISFLWGAVANQIAMDASGTITCVAWNSAAYANFACANLYSSGNVTAATLNNYGFQLDGTKPSANQIIHSGSDSHTYLGYINSNIPDEGIVPGHFYVSNGSDNFIRKTNASTVFSNLPVNLAVLHSGTSGYSAGTAIVGGQYGAIYWIDTDASINLYHSAIGHALKIRMGAGNIPEYYLPNVRGDIGPANSGRLYRVGNTLMIS